MRRFFSRDLVREDEPEEVRAAREVIAAWESKWTYRLQDAASVGLGDGVRIWIREDGDVLKCTRCADPFFAEDEIAMSSWDGVKEIKHKEVCPREAYENMQRIAEMEERHTIKRLAAKGWKVEAPDGVGAAEKP